MNNQHNKKISKFLSLILRHNPSLIHLKLDENGWASVDFLLKNKKQPFSLAELKEVVETNDKKRFSFNEDGTKIRANQGHSISNINLELKSKTPPEFLYHGTVGKFLSAIREKGLLKMNRQHVHLSQERETAIKVGSRRGKPIILSIRSGEMSRKGHDFYLSENGVWLTNHIPSEFIEFKN